MGILFSNVKYRISGNFRVCLIFAEFATTLRSPKIDTAKNKPYYTSSLRVLEIAKIRLSENLTHLPSVIFAKISRREKFPIYGIPLTNVKWHSDPWPTVTSQPIRLSTNFMTLITSLTFTDYEWFPWSICNGCGMPAGNAYPSGHLVPSPILGLANAPIVETKFLELAMSLIDFSPRIPLGTFSILLSSETQWLFFEFWIVKKNFEIQKFIL